MTIAPNEIITDVSVETVDTVQGLFIPLESLGLTASQANPTTGDGRIVVQKLVMACFDGINALPEPPKQIILTETNAVIGENRQRTTLAFDFNLSISRADFQLLPE